MKNATPTEEFFIKMDGSANHRQMSKIRMLVEEYDKFTKKKPNEDDEESLELYYNTMQEKFNKLIDDCNKIKIGNIVTINRLIETSFGIDKNTNQYSKSGEKSNMCRKMLNTLYRMNKDKFLINFVA